MTSIWHNHRWLTVISQEMPMGHITHLDNTLNMLMLHNALTTDQFFKRIMWKFNNMEITIWKAKIYSQEAYQNWSTCKEMSWKQNYARFWRNDKGNGVTLLYAPETSWLRWARKKLAMGRQTSQYMTYDSIWHNLTQKWIRPNIL